jgi:mRNA interferase RelE/StbE
MKKFKIHFHTDVIKKDFSKFNKKDQLKIARTIQEKLSIDPIAFGKPLQKELKGYYRLRISDSRVIYKIEKNKVLVYILKIGFRRNQEVYLEAIKRIK